MVPVSGLCGVARVLWGSNVVIVGLGRVQRWAW